MIRSLFICVPSPITTIARGSAERKFAATSQERNAHFNSAPQARDSCAMLPPEQRRACVKCDSVTTMTAICVRLCENFSAFSFYCSAVDQWTSGRVWEYSGCACFSLNEAAVTASIFRRCNDRILRRDVGTNPFLILRFWAKLRNVSAVTLKQLSFFCQFLTIILLSIFVSVKNIKKEKREMLGWQS